jgi:metal-responsive CopG/Arc/MetJ family transcriptional regulator
MKSTISIPDPLFEQAERMARQLGLSRSQLYAMAVESFLKDHEQQAVTAVLDRIYSEEPSALDPALARLQAVHLPKDVEPA